MIKGPVCAPSRFADQTHRSESDAKEVLRNLLGQRAVPRDRSAHPFSLFSLVSPLSPFVASKPEIYEARPSAERDPAGSKKGQPLSVAAKAIKAPEIATNITWLAASQAAAVRPFHGVRCLAPSPSAFQIRQSSACAGKKVAAHTFPETNRRPTHLGALDSFSLLHRAKTASKRTSRPKLA